MEERVLCKARFLRDGLIELFVVLRDKGARILYDPATASVKKVETAPPIDSGERLRVPRRAVEAIAEGLNGNHNGDLDRYAWAMLQVLSRIEPAN